MSYNDIEIPPDKRPEHYSYVERRAEVFERIVEAGHPDMVSRTELGAYYGVNPSTITRDIQAIRDDIAEGVMDDAEIITETFYRKAVREKIEAEAYMDANKLIKDWNTWLFDMGKQERFDHKASEGEKPYDLAEQWVTPVADEDYDDVMGTDSTEPENDEMESEGGDEATIHADSTD